MPSQLNPSLSPDSESSVLDSKANAPKLDSLVAGRNSAQSDSSDSIGNSKEAAPKPQIAEADGNSKPPVAESQDYSGEDKEKGSAELKGKDQGAKDQSARDQGGKGKGRSQQGKGREARGNKTNSRNKNKNKNGGNRGSAKAPQEVDGNRDPNAVGEVGTSLQLTLSKALMVKLKRQAKSEGVSMEALATELISEGAVLRAWEIVERKGHLRDASSNQSGNSHGGGGNNQRRGGGGNNRQHKGGNGNGGGNNRNMNRQRYNSIMDDKANFLEYVRNQEKFNR